MLAEILMDRINDLQDLRIADNHRIEFGGGEGVSEDEANDWVSTQLDRAMRLTQGLTKASNSIVSQVINTDDVAVISSSARQLAAGYRKSLEWAAELRKASLPEIWEPLIEEMSLILGKIPTTLQELGPLLVGKIDEMVLRPSEDWEPIKVEFVLELANSNRFNEELEKMH